MNPRIARSIAWSLVVLYIILAATGLVLQAISGQTYAAMLPVLSILVGLVTAWMITGALIISRHPQHPIGWLLCAGLFSTAIDMFAAGFAAFDALLLSGSLPGVDLALVWIKLGNMGPIGVVAFTLIILLFPDGRFSSPPWRMVAWTTVGTLLLFLPLQAVEPGSADPFFLPTRANPLAVGEALWANLKPLLWVGFSVLMLCYGAALLSLVFRLGRARGDTRQQIKWLIFPAGLFGIFLVVFSVGTQAADEVIIGLSLALGQVASAGMVIAIAFAIFRYRLYDIDLIIRRTLIYGLLTAALALVYFGSVLIFQRLIPAQSEVAVVASTLAIAALFTPLRSRIQRAIDRRFYRQKYDAEQILRAFGYRLRDEVELESLSHLLVSAVGDSLQPAHLSLWLQEAAPKA